MILAIGEAIGTVSLPCGVRKIFQIDDLFLFLQLHEFFFLNHLMFRVEYLLEFLDGEMLEREDS